MLRNIPPEYLRSLQSSVGKEQLAKLESMSHWDAFLVANKKALAKKKNKK